MKSQSCKAKGRRHQQRVRRKILDTFGLKEDDISSRSMGAGGEDLLLSPKAREYFPFSVECKNSEKVSIWSWWEQAQSNAQYKPLLVFKRNNSQDLAVLRFDDLLELLKEKE